MVQRNLSKATADLKSSMQRLSTGLRINSAGDDAAGLSLSEKLKAQIGAADVTKSNAQTGINMLQVADGDLSIINDNLQRMRDLAVQSANGVYSTSERQAIDKEIQLRMAEINRIAKSSSFSELNLLDGSLSGADKCLLQIGVYSGLSQNTIDISSALGKATCTALGINGNSVTTAALARTFMDNLDTAIVNMANRRAVVGASINRLNSTIDRIE
jgi:flagellin